MKYNSIKKDNTTTSYRDFDSMNEFYTYITTTPFNLVFKNSNYLSSIDSPERFTKTKSFEEAVELFKNGWDDMANKLETKLSLIAKQVQPKTTLRSKYDVIGFQASVPRYLQGIPTSMINQKQVAQKQRVITLNKDISYKGGYSTEQIIENSVKALQIIKKIEAQGIRCNLNLVFGSCDSSGGKTENIIVKIRLKSSNERLNISKLAFPLVHPSMLRRLLFRFIEVSPDVTLMAFRSGYGVPSSEKDLQSEKEYLLPREIRDVDEVIKSFNL